MAHHRNPARGQKLDGLGHTHAAFHLHRAAVSLLHHARSGMKRLFLGGLVRTERHVHDNERFLRAAHHSMTLQDHHIERDGHRGLEAVHDVAQGVADEDHVAILVDQPRGMRVIGRQHHDRVAALALEDIWRSLALDG